jgi:hypothetical protein
MTTKYASLFEKKLAAELEGHRQKDGRYCPPIADDGQRLMNSSEFARYIEDHLVFGSRWEETRLAAQPKEPEG